MKNQIIGIAFLFVGATLLWAIGIGDILKKTQHPAPTSFQEYVARGLDLSQKENELPGQWVSIGSVTFNNHVDQGSPMIIQSELKIPIRTGGHYHLEIEGFNFPEDKNPKLILQMSLFDIRSKNKVWELGKTFTMDDFKNLSASKESPDAVSK